MRPKVALGAGFGVFLVIVAFLIAPTFRKTEIDTFKPRVVGIAVPTAPGTVDTVTVDAGSDRAWRFFDFERGLVSDPPDTAGWDLALQRFHLIPSGEIANLGRTSFDALHTPPDTGYVRTIMGRDTVNDVTDKWYSYSYLSHLLVPKGDVYVLRTREGNQVKLQMAGYYCPGTTPGCVTFRYALLPQRPGTSR